MTKVAKKKTKKKATKSASRKKTFTQKLGLRLANINRRATVALNSLYPKVQKVRTDWQNKRISFTRNPKVHFALGTLAVLLIGLGAFMGIRKIQQNKNEAVIHGVLNNLAVSAQATYAERGFYPRSVKEIGFVPAYNKKTLDYIYDYKSNGKAFAAAVKRQGKKMYINHNGVVLNQNFEVISAGRFPRKIDTQLAIRTIKQLYLSKRQ